MDMKTAVIYRLEELIRQKDITVNEAAIRSGVPPSTLKNILYTSERYVNDKRYWEKRIAYLPDAPELPTLSAEDVKKNFTRRC